MTFHKSCRQSNIVVFRHLQETIVKFKRTAVASCVVGNNDCHMARVKKTQIQSGYDSHTIYILFQILKLHTIVF
jgi:hypothetical protein